MNKLLSILFIGLILSSTVMADAIQTEDTKLSLMPYCGPNDIDCNERVDLDIVFVIDSTGSMHDEIRTIKEEMINIIDNVNKGYPRPNVNVGVVTYRDYKPQENNYLTKASHLTSNLETSIRFIKNLDALGGGDYEEAVEAGLDEAINEMNWRKTSERIIILVGDAPARNNPQEDYESYGNFQEKRIYNWKNAVDDANEKNIRIFTASGSGMNDEGIRQWKAIARNTGGSFISLTYERQQVNDYFEEREIPVEYLEDARTSRDYDRTTDSVMTNNFGIFASKAAMAVAEDAGIEYSEEGNSLSDITGEIVKENKENNELKEFFEKIFQRIIFWN